MTAASVREGAAPRELLRLVEEIDPRPARVEALAPSDTYRAAPGAFRVTLADGRHLKARTMTGVERAVRVECILRALDHSAFPSVVARRGAILLLEWIDGEDLEELEPRPGWVRAAAAIQAFLHAMPVPPALERPADAIGATTAKLERDVAALVADGTVAAAESAALLALARRSAPDACRTGIVHRDLCARNMIVRPSGEICLVDNETMAVGACEFDLARTWYRWPLSRGEREEYFRAYGRTHDPRPFLAHFAFWALAVLADSACMRAAAGAALRAVPVDRLRAVVAALDGGASPERIALQS
jgi:hypothetical protein